MYGQGLIGLAFERHVVKPGDTGAAQDSANARAIRVAWSGERGRHLLPRKGAIACPRGRRHKHRIRSIPHMDVPTRVASYVLTADPATQHIAGAANDSDTILSGCNPGWFRSRLNDRFQALVSGVRVFTDPFGTM